jgi:copper ion binding protein
MDTPEPITKSDAVGTSGSVLHRIHVDGMDCRSCEDLLVETLRRQPGVGAASADARTGTLSVLVDPALVAHEDIARAVVACGFVPEGVKLAEAGPGQAAVRPVVVEVPEYAADAVVHTPAAIVEAPAPIAVPVAREGSFAVTGMTCASCSAVIEKVVGKVAGVESVNVNLATERMSVRFDPSVVDEDGLIAVVKKAGYGAILLGGGVRDSGPRSDDCLLGGA